MFSDSFWHSARISCARRSRHPAASLSSISLVLTVTFRAAERAAASRIAAAQPASEAAIMEPFLAAVLTSVSVSCVFSRMWSGDSAARLSACSITYLRAPFSSSVPCGRRYAAASGLNASASSSMRFRNSSRSRPASRIRVFMSSRTASYFFFPTVSEATMLLREAASAPQSAAVPPPPGTGAFPESSCVKSASVICCICSTRSLTVFSPLIPSLSNSVRHPSYRRPAR